MDMIYQMIVPRVRESNGIQTPTGLKTIHFRWTSDGPDEDVW